MTTHSNTLTFLILSFLSFFLVAFGQETHVPGLGVLAGSVGYALFWFGLLRNYSRTRDRFWGSFIWFALVQGIQLSWFCSIKYMGPPILIVYLFLVLLIAFQFGFLCLFFRSGVERISLHSCFAASGAWVLLEWSRLFVFSGFNWNPAGLALTASNYAIQFAAVFGVYGLSFFVLLTNLLALYAWKSWKRKVAWVVVALIPYFYGVMQQQWVKRAVSVEQELSVALVQTGLLPEQKDRLLYHGREYIPPLNQWERIWDSLAGHTSLDLIVFPESAVTMGAKRACYPLEIVSAIWEACFGLGSSSCFPVLESPYAYYLEEKGWRVSNLFIAQALSNHFHARVITGFDDRDGREAYNAAFDLLPGRSQVRRYEKRVLVPMGEYVPLSDNKLVASFLSAHFGIHDSFTKGKEATLFDSSFPLGVSICSEETYGGLVRDLRQKGARLFVNLTNDVWFPSTHLPMLHFQHGRVRSCENGVCTLRACNTGITGAIDCFGRAIKTIPPSEDKIDLLQIKLPVRCYRTLFSFWGDRAILLLSVFFLLLPVVRNGFLRKSQNMQ